MRTPPDHKPLLAALALQACHTPHTYASGGYFGLVFAMLPSPEIFVNLRTQWKTTPASFTKLAGYIHWEVYVTMAEVTPKWTEEEVQSDAVSKKDLVAYLQEIASVKFQQEHKLKGQLKSIAKTKAKDQLVIDYKNLFETKDFKQAGEDEAFEKLQAEKKAADELTSAAKKLELKDSSAGDAPEVPRYKKDIKKKGNKVNYPMRGDNVLVYYTGRLEDGKVFDTNDIKGKKGNHKNQPMKFKVGKGLVIKGWDEALLTMSIGEKAEITIEPEWGYGRRGIEGKIPPNATLIFEVELVNIE